jgi:mRNA-degrading endonuclease RelE of RelBE toxin-antitoxin system
MGWRIEFEDQAESGLRDLGFPGDREVLEYLSRWIAPSEDPRRVGHKYGDQWRYRTNGVDIIVKIKDGALGALTSASDAEESEAQDAPTILVLAIRPAR